MQKNRGITPVIIFLVVTAFAGLGMLVYSNWPKELKVVPEVKNSVVLDETKDWKTYRNEKYGFEFRYPSQYELDNVKDDLYDYSGDRIAIVVAKEKFINNSFFSIFASELGRLGECSAKKVDSILLKKKIINGNTFIVFSDKQKDSAMGGARALYSYYQISHEGLCYELKSQVYWSEVGWASYAETGKSNATDSEIVTQKEIIEKHAQILDDILSTFKFISKDESTSIDTSDWKTYRNEKYGFEFKYPKSNKSEDFMIEKFERGEMIRFRVDQSRIFAVEIINKNPSCPDTAAAADIPNKIIDGIDFVGVGGHQIGEAINIGGYSFPYGNADSYCALVNGLEYKILMSTTSKYDEKIENPRTDPTLRQILSTFKFIPQKQNDEVSNWKTYRNEKYGFEFKTPEGLSFKQKIIDSGDSFSLKEGISADIPASYNLPNSFQRSQKILAGITSEDTQVKCVGRYDVNSKQSVPLVIFNGVTFTKDIHHDCAMDGCGFNVIYHTWKNNECYAFGSFYIQGSYSKYYDIVDKTDPRYVVAEKDSKVTTENINKLTEEILSTFKFISKDESTAIDTKGFKTYRNEKYGFELRYPSKYKIENYSRDWDIRFVDNDKNEIHLEVESISGDYCVWGLCTKEKTGSLSKNGIIWDDLGLNQYCDVGQCSGEKRVYRTVHLDNRFTVLSGLTDKQIEEEFLSNFKFIDKNPTSEKPVLNLNTCFVGGCSGELCLEAKDSGMASTCEWKEEYACYKKTKCERQQTGKCGWTETPEFKSCLANPLPKQ